MKTAKQIAGFRVSWTADHGQYYQGHSIMLSDYTHSGGGCGETLREAFEDALGDLVQQYIMVPEDVEAAMLAELTGQVREPAMLDMGIVEAECPEQGEHYDQDLPCTCDANEESSNECDRHSQPLEDPDCAVCGGDWHFYVNVDVKMED